MQSNPIQSNVSKSSKSLTLKLETDHWMDTSNDLFVKIHCKELIDIVTFTTEPKETTVSPV